MGLNSASHAATLARCRVLRRLRWPPAPAFEHVHNQKGKSYTEAGICRVESISRRCSNCRSLLGDGAAPLQAAVDAVQTPDGLLHLHLDSVTPSHP
jgi:hypothetical protein